MNMLPDSTYGKKPYSEYNRSLKIAHALGGVAFIGVFAIFLMFVYGLLLSFNPDSWLVLFYGSQILAIVIFGGASVAFLGGLIWGVSSVLTAASKVKIEAVTYYNATEHREHARVASKMISPLDEHLTEFHIAIDFANGQRKSFTVNAQQYNAIFEDEVGMIIYKQNGAHLFYGQFYPQR